MPDMVTHKDFKVLVHMSLLFLGGGWVAKHYAARHPNDDVVLTCRTDAKVEACKETIPDGSKTAVVMFELVS